MSVRVELRRFEFVAFEIEDRLDYFLIVLVRMTFYHFGARRRVSPGSGNVYLYKVVARGGVNRVIVHLNNRVALSAE